MYAPSFPVSPPCSCAPPLVSSYWILDGQHIARVMLEERNRRLGEGVEERYLPACLRVVTANILTPKSTLEERRRAAGSEQARTRSGSDQNTSTLLWLMSIPENEPGLSPDQRVLLGLSKGGVKSDEPVCNRPPCQLLRLAVARVLPLRLLPGPMPLALRAAWFSTYCVSRYALLPRVCTLPHPLRRTRSTRGPSWSAGWTSSASSSWTPSRSSSPAGRG